MGRTALKALGALLGLLAGPLLGAGMGFAVLALLEGDLPSLAQLQDPGPGDIGYTLFGGLGWFVGMVAGPPAGYLLTQKLCGEVLSGGVPVVAGAMALTVLVVIFSDGLGGVTPATVAVLVGAAILSGLLGALLEQQLDSSEQQR